MTVPVVIAADIVGVTMLARVLNSSSSSLTKFVLRLCCAEHREVAVARKKRSADTRTKLDRIRKIPANRKRDIDTLRVVCRKELDTLPKRTDPTGANALNSVLSDSKNQRDVEKKKRHKSRGTSERRRRKKKNTSSGRSTASIQPIIVNPTMGEFRHHRPEPQQGPVEAREPTGCGREPMRVRVIPVEISPAYASHAKYGTANAVAADKTVPDSTLDDWHCEGDYSFGISAHTLSSLPLDALREATARQTVGSETQAQFPGSDAAQFHIAGSMLRQFTENNRATSKDTINEEITDLPQSLEPAPSQAIDGDTHAMPKFFAINSTPLCDVSEVRVEHINPTPLVDKEQESRSPYQSCSHSLEDAYDMDFSLAAAATEPSIINFPAMQRFDSSFSTIMDSESASCAFDVATSEMVQPTNPMSPDARLDPEHSSPMLATVLCSSKRSSLTTSVSEFTTSTSSKMKTTRFLFPVEERREFFPSNTQVHRAPRTLIAASVTNNDEYATLKSLQEFDLVDHITLAPGNAVANTLNMQEPPKDDCTVRAMERENQNAIVAAPHSSTMVVFESVSDKMNVRDSAAELSEIAPSDRERATVRSSIAEKGECTVKHSETAIEGEESKTEDSKLTIEGGERTVEHAELIIEGGERTVEHSELIIEGGERTVEHSELIIEGGKRTVEHSELIIEGGERTVEHSELIIEGEERTVEHSELVIERGERTVEHSELIIEGGERTVEHSELIIEGGDCTVEHFELTIEGGERTMEHSNTTAGEENFSTEPVDIATGIGAHGKGRPETIARDAFCATDHVATMSQEEEMYVTEKPEILLDEQYRAAPQVAIMAEEGEHAMKQHRNIAEEGKCSVSVPKAFTECKEDDATERPTIITGNGYYAAQVTDTNVNNKSAAEVPKDDIVVAHSEEERSKQKIDTEKTAPYRSENNEHKDDSTILNQEITDEVRANKQSEKNIFVEEQGKRENDNEEEMKKYILKTTMGKEDRKTERGDDRQKGCGEGEETNVNVESDGECNDEVTAATLPQLMAKGEDHAVEQLGNVPMERKEEEGAEGEEKICVTELSKTGVVEGGHFTAQDEENEEEEEKQEEGQNKCDEDRTLTAQENCPYSLVREKCQAEQFTKTMKDKLVPTAVLQINADNEECAKGKEPEAKAPKDDKTSQEPHATADRSAPSRLVVTLESLPDHTAFAVSDSDTDIPMCQDTDTKFKKRMVAKAMSGFMSLDGTHDGKARSPRTPRTHRSPSSTRNGKTVPQVFVTTPGTVVPKVELDEDHNVLVEVQHGEQVMVQTVGGVNMRVQIPGITAKGDNGSKSDENQLVSRRENCEPSIDSTVLRACSFVTDASCSNRNASAPSYRLMRNASGSSL